MVSFLFLKVLFSFIIAHHEKQESILLSVFVSETSQEPADRFD